MDTIMQLIGQYLAVGLACGVAGALLVISANRRLIDKQNTRERKKEQAAQKQKEFQELGDAMSKAFGKPAAVAIPILRSVYLYIYPSDTTAERWETNIHLPSFFWDIGNPQLLAGTLVILVKNLRKNRREEGYMAIAKLLIVRAQVNPLHSLAVLVECVRKDAETAKYLGQYIRDDWECCDKQAACELKKNQ